MVQYTREEMDKALKIVVSTIVRCEMSQPKFAEGTSQHTLLRNRIHALRISKSLLAQEDIERRYTKEELAEALRPLSSVIGKCEKARHKFQEGTAHHTRFTDMIRAMDIARTLISDELSRTD